MSVVALALRRPYTFIVMAMLIVLATPFALLQHGDGHLSRKSTFRSISIIWNYNGLPAQEMGQRIAGAERARPDHHGQRHRAHRVDSRSPASRSSRCSSSRPPTSRRPSRRSSPSMQTQVRQLPPGITPPLVIKYSASSIPVDPARRCRARRCPSSRCSTPRSTCCGRSSSRSPASPCRFPYGGKNRVISVDLDTQALQARGLSPADVVNAINTQNLILPSGTAKFGATEYTVQMNGSPDAISGPERPAGAHRQAAPPPTCATSPTCATASRRRPTSCARTARAACCCRC